MKNMYEIEHCKNVCMDVTLSRYSVLIFALDLCKMKEKYVYLHCTLDHPQSCGSKLLQNV